MVDEWQASQRRANLTFVDHCRFCWENREVPRSILNTYAFTQMYFISEGEVELVNENGEAFKVVSSQFQDNQSLA